jgi:hypothetical protein
MPAPPPRVDALILCDQVLEDRRTGKFGLIGLTERVSPPHFPIALDGCRVYARVTSLRGAYRFRVEVVGPDLAIVVARSEGTREVESTDPLRGFQLEFFLPRIRFERPGRYTIRLLYDRGVAAEVVVPVYPQEALP